MGGVCVNAIQLVFGAHRLSLLSQANCMSACVLDSCRILRVMQAPFEKECFIDSSFFVTLAICYRIGIISDLNLTIGTLKNSSFSSTSQSKFSFWIPSMRMQHNIQTAYITVHTSLFMMLTFPSKSSLMHLIVRN